MSAFSPSFVTPVFRYVFENTTSLLTGVEVFSFFNETAWVSVLSLFDRTNVATGIPYLSVPMAYIHQSDEHHRLMHTDADTNVFSDAVDHTHMAMAFPLTARSLNLTLGFLLDRSLNSTARELYVRNPMGAFLNLASGYLREDTTTPLIDPPELPRLIASYQSFLAVTGLNLEETCRADSFLDSVMKVSEPEVTQSFWMAGICAMSLVAASSLLLRQFFSSTSAGATSCTLGVAAFIALAPQASALALFTAVLASAVVSAIPIPNLMAETAMQGRSASAQGHHSTEASA